MAKLPCEDRRTEGQVGATRDGSCWYGRLGARCLGGMSSQSLGVAEPGHKGPSALFED